MPVFKRRAGEIRKNERRYGVPVNFDELLAKRNVSYLNFCSEKQIRNFTFDNFRKSDQVINEILTKKRTHKNAYGVLVGGLSSKYCRRWGKNSLRQNIKKKKKKARSNSLEIFSLMEGKFDFVSSLKSVIITIIQL